MKRLLFGLPVLLIFVFSDECYPHGPRGGGGGGFRGGGGFSRPSMPAHSPSFGGGGGGFSRPAMPSGTRSGMVPQNRSNFGGGDRSQVINYPGQGNRSNFGGGGNRSQVINRPGQGGSGERAQVINRPGQGNRPDFRPDNRPNFRPGDRDGLRPDVNVNNFNRTNNVIGSGNRAVVGSGNRNAWGSVNRNAWGYANRGGWANRPYYNHGNWYHGGWSGWYRNPAWWVAGAATAGWLLSPGYVYSNPFYVAPAAVIDPGLDYSQPIAVPQAIVPQTVVMPDQQPDLASAETAAAAPVAEEQPIPEDADREFTAARESFKSGNYQQALTQVDQAIAKLPSDPVLHEFRGLVLFALKRYPEAAATIYAVLSSGPGWNWDTMKALYPNEQTYTNQLRALEEYQRQNPKSADGHFLLAYHYLVLDYPDQAAKQLEQVVKLLPNDKLCPEILKALKPPAGQRPNPGGG